MIMKNNLLTINVEKTVDVEERFLMTSDLLELLVMNKMQRGDLDDIVEEMTAALGQEYENISEEDCDCCDECNERENGNGKRVTNLCDNHSMRLVCAGYMDCMDEAIRFLVEEENISPEHPVVRNLKAHLEQSKERILETASDVEFRDSEIRHLRLSTIEDVPYHEIHSPCAWNTG